MSEIQVKSTASDFSSVGVIDNKKTTFNKRVSTLQDSQFSNRVIYVVGAGALQNSKQPSLFDRNPEIRKEIEVGNSENNYDHLSPHLSPKADEGNKENLGQVNNSTLAENNYEVDPNFLSSAENNYEVDPNFLSSAENDYEVDPNFLSSDNVDNNIHQYDVVGNHDSVYSHLEGIGRLVSQNASDLSNVNSKLLVQESNINKDSEDYQKLSDVGSFSQSSLSPFPVGEDAASSSPPLPAEDYEVPNSLNKHLDMAAETNPVITEEPIYEEIPSLIGNSADGKIYDKLEEELNQGVGLLNNVRENVRKRVGDVGGFFSKKSRLNTDSETSTRLRRTNAIKLRK